MDQKGDAVIAVCEVCSEPLIFLIWSMDKTNYLLLQEADQIVCPVCKQRNKLNEDLKTLIKEVRKEYLKQRYTSTDYAEE